MLRVMLREMLRQVLRWLLRSMPTDVLREMPTLVPTVVLPVLRTLLLRLVPTTFANHGANHFANPAANRPQPGHDHGQRHDREQSTPGSCIRSGRATNGDEANAVETLFADRHHLLTKSLWKKRGKTGAAKSDKKRQRTCRNMTPFVAGNLPPIAAFCRSQDAVSERLKEKNQP